MNTGFGVYGAENGKVWKLMESSQIPIWELGGSCGYLGYTIWDLQGGRYVADFSMIGSDGKVLHEVRYPTRNTASIALVP